MRRPAASYQQALSLHAWPPCLLFSPHPHPHPNPNAQAPSPASGHHGFWLTTDPCPVWSGAPSMRSRHRLMENQCPGEAAEDSGANIAQQERERGGGGQSNELKDGRRRGRGRGGGRRKLGREGGREDEIGDKKAE